MPDFDLAVIGAGAAGLSVAASRPARPECRADRARRDGRRLPELRLRAEQGAACRRPCRDRGARAAGRLRHPPGRAADRLGRGARACPWRDRRDRAHTIPSPLPRRSAPPCCAAAARFVGPGHAGGGRPAADRPPHRHRRRQQRRRSPTSPAWRHVPRSPTRPCSTCTAAPGPPADPGRRRRSGWRWRRRMPRLGCRVTVIEARTHRRAEDAELVAGLRAAAGGAGRRLDGRSVTRDRRPNPARPLVARGRHAGSPARTCWSRPAGGRTWTASAWRPAACAGPRRGSRPSRAAQSSTNRRVWAVGDIADPAGHRAARLHPCRPLSCRHRGAPRAVPAAGADRLRRPAARHLHRPRARRRSGRPRPRRVHAGQPRAAPALAAGRERPRASPRAAPPGW